MATPLIPQEVYLLERYASLDYFGDMRDQFAICLKAAEDALAAFMTKLPPDYRRRPLYDQPDRVWGARIIPNLVWALRGLDNGYLVLSKGDPDGLSMAGNVVTSFASIQRDYSWEWMPQPFYDRADAAETVCWQMASNINATQQGNWQMYELSSQYQTSSRGPLDPPPSWPLYRLNAGVRVKTDDKIPRNGVYLPDAPHSCAQYLIEGYEAWDTSVLNNPNDPDDRSDTRVPTTWTLVERVADSGGGIPGETDPIKGGVRLRCEAGRPCPKAGWWFTPAKKDSRRRYAQGEAMPEVGSGYGLTIWQWDDEQR